jgi:hypothetical protein
VLLVAALIAPTLGCGEARTARHEQTAATGKQPTPKSGVGFSSRAAEARLWPLPKRARLQCARLQARVRFIVLCPQRVPRPTRGWKPGDSPPPLYSDIFGSLSHPELRTPYGLELGYSAPVEPQSGRNWRQLVWHNRPCCFLHFTIFLPHSPLPSGLMRARLGGKRGRALYATGYGLRGSQGFYWSNHTWFFWREYGVEYAASLHYFGRGTKALLERLIRELRPAKTIR